MIRLLQILALLICFMPNTVLAQNETPDTTLLRNIPIQHEGRLKSLDSFARITLHKLSAQDSLSKLSALDWLTLTLFDPQNAALVKVVKIDNDQVRHKLSLPDNDELLSLTDLSIGIQKTQPDIVALLQKDPATLTRDEAALIETHEKAATIITLMRSFSGILPLDVQIPSQYAAELDTQPSFINLLQVEQKLQQEVKNIVTQKGNDPSKFTTQEGLTAQLGFNLHALRTGGQNNTLLRIIPTTWDDAGEQYVSPWATILGGQGSPASSFLLSQWNDLAQSYRNNDRELWAQIATELVDETYAQAETTEPSTRFAVERIYRAASPYFWITCLYAAILTTLIANIFRSNTAIFSKIAAPLTALTLLLHGSALASRIYILDRPPVGTLYESILFVSFIAAFAGLFMFIKKRNTLVLGAGVFSALILLLSAPVFEPAGDNLEVLVAVLNTGFWLSTHVLMITAGYAFCIVTATLAHIALGLGNKHTALRMTLQNNVYYLSLIALFLTAVGTVLGGIWADQSWGRFWGWDPKENGALLIVLWLIWVQHGRLSNRFKPPVFLALMALLNVVVAISWFGVNLLNVGLHSYGFTTGMAEGLIAFCTAEGLLITALFWRNRQQRNTA